MKFLVFGLLSLLLAGCADVTVEAWTASAILYTVEGKVVVIVSEVPYPTKEACEKVNADGLAQVQNNPELLAVGAACAKVIVRPTTNSGKFPAKPIEQTAV